MEQNLQIDLSMAITSPMDMRSERSVPIRIHDRASGIIIMEIELTPNQLVGALSGHYTRDISAFFTPNRDLIGKQMVNETISVPEKIQKKTNADHTFTGALFTSLDEIKNDDVYNWITEQLAHGGWTDFSYKRHNYGWGLHVRKWVSSERLNVSTVELRPGDVILGDGYSEKVKSIDPATGSDGDYLMVTTNMGRSRKTRDDTFLVQRTPDVANGELQEGKH